MASVSPAAGLAACAVGAAALCGATSLTVQAPAAARVAASPTAAPLGQDDAVRLARQATFGPTSALVDHMSGMTIDAWLDEQFAASGSTYADLAQRVIAPSKCKSLPQAERGICQRDYLSPEPVQMRFYADAVGREDQLRQRVAFALSQLTVASNVSVRSTAGAAGFNQILLANAFGNYRDLLEAVTLNPYMGDFLDLASSVKGAPNENYARELMQLFTLGADLLNPDGTPALGADGQPSPAYTQADISEVARALTGWSCVKIDPGVDPGIDYSRPMVSTPKKYDADAKSFLGVRVPAGASPEASVDAVLDAIFHHANMPPFIAKFLIGQLVVSNPSPAYVQRVAAVFADNGSGVRGDLKAVIRAILKDPEARAAPGGNPLAGKLKEPVLLTTSLARAIGTTTDGYAFTRRDDALGQQPFLAPSVFNFYPPDYPLPLGDSLESPPSKLMTTATVISRHDLIYDWTLGSPGRSEFKPADTMEGATGTSPDWASWEALDVDQQLDRAALLLGGGGLNPAQRQKIRAAMMAVVNRDPALQARKRAQTAIYVLASSPLFQIDR